MQVELHESGPPFWLLGSPSNTILHLTFASPGPVELDYSKLSPEDQSQLLMALQQEKILTSVPFEELHREWLQNRPEAPVPPPDVKEYLDQERAVKEQERRLKIQAGHEEKERKFHERCSFLSGKNARSVKSALAGEKDLRLLRNIRKLEQAKKKPRIGVMDYLTDRIKKLQVEVVHNIEDKTSDTPIMIATKHESVVYKGKTIQFDVVESEQETVEFLQSDLDEASNKESQVGE